MQHPADLCQSAMKRNTTVLFKSRLWEREGMEDYSSYTAEAGFKFKQSGKLRIFLKLMTFI